MKLDIWINMYAICGLIFMLSAMRKYPCHISIKSDYKRCAWWCHSLVWYVFICICTYLCICLYAYLYISRFESLCFQILDSHFLNYFFFFHLVYRCVWTYGQTVFSRQSFWSSHGTGFLTAVLLSRWLQFPSERPNIIPFFLGLILVSDTDCHPWALQILSPPFVLLA